MYKNRDKKGVPQKKQEENLENEDFLNEKPIEEDDKEEEIEYHDEIRRTIDPTGSEEVQDRNTQKKIISDKYDKRKYHKIVSPREMT